MTLSTMTYRVCVLIVLFTGCAWRPENQRGATMVSGAAVMLTGAALIVVDGRCWGTVDKDAPPRCEYVNDTESIGEPMVFIGATVSMVGAIMLLLLDERELNERERVHP